MRGGLQTHLDPKGLAKGDWWYTSDCLRATEPTSRPDPSSLTTIFVTTSLREISLSNLRRHAGNKSIRPSVPLSLRLFARVGDVCCCMVVQRCPHKGTVALMSCPSSRHHIRHTSSDPHPYSHFLQSYQIQVQVPSTHLLTPTFYNHTKSKSKFRALTFPFLLPAILPIQC